MGNYEVVSTLLCWKQIAFGLLLVLFRECHEGLDDEYDGLFLWYDHLSKYTIQYGFSSYQLKTSTIYV
jgi:hypothetical protein